MRTYDDTFSGEKIYPGKVRHQHSVESELQQKPAAIGNPGLRNRGHLRPQACTMEIWKTNADRAILIAGQTLRSRRQQDLPLPKRQNRVPLPPAQEPPPDRMDNALPKAA